MFGFYMKDGADTGNDTCIFNVLFPYYIPSLNKVFTSINPETGWIHYKFSHSICNNIKHKCPQFRLFTSFILAICYRRKDLVNVYIEVNPDGPIRRPMF